MSRFSDSSQDIFDFHRGIEKYVHEKKAKFLRNNIGIGNAYLTPANLTAALDSDKEKILYFWFGDCLVGDMKFWQDISDICQYKNKKIYVITDSLGESLELPGIKFYLEPELQGVFLVNDYRPLVPNRQKKLFSCFVQRIESVRQSWLYFFNHYNLLDNCYISFLYKQCRDYSELSGPDLYHWIHQHFKLDQLEHFQKAYIDLTDKIPYVNIDDFVHIEPYIENSKYGLSLDTYATSDNYIFKHATAQTMRLLQYPCLPLFFLQHGTIQCIKKLGLSIPDYLENIDSLETWQSRQRAILDVLINDPIELNQTECADRAYHNRNMFRSWQNTLSNTDYLENLFERIRND